MYSERAVKQLKEISRLLDEGYRACYILVSLNPSVKEIVINAEVKDYYKELYGVDLSGEQVQRMYHPGREAAAGYKK